MTHKDDPREPDALVLSVRKLISDAPISAQSADGGAPLVLQASQRVAPPPSPEPVVLTHVGRASADAVEPELPKPEAPLSHDLEYLEVIANLRRALAGPMHDELSSPDRTMIDDSDPAASVRRRYERRRLERDAA